VDLRETDHRSAARPLGAESILALQRSAGNRAVVQRLTWNAKTGNLGVPNEYASQRIPWDGSYTAERAPTGTDKTFFELAKQGTTFHAQVQEGLGLEWLDTVKPFPKDDAEKGSAPFVSNAMKGSQVPGDNAVYGKMVVDVAAGAVSQDQLITLTPGAPFADLGAVKAARRFVPRPSAFLPEAPDLPEMGVDLFSAVPNGNGKKYWEYACVLIALYKAEGITRVKELVKRDVPDAVVPAVHALHDYYISHEVQYDDGSARNRVMSDWGYSRVFAGFAHWDELPGRVELPSGTYIFDIEGHTVKVKILKDISTETKIDRRTDYFAPESDPKNYNPGKEFSKQITAIWKKG
jgi:hypothetical protein